MNDWDGLFRIVSQAMWTGYNPYTEITLDPPFVHPPWLWLPIAPFFWVPWWLAMFFPMAVLFYSARKVRKPWLIFVVGTSFPFLSMSLYAVPDWIAWLGIMMGGPIGLFLSTTKPQVGVFSVLVDIKRAENWQERIKIFMPTAIIGGAMTLLYPMWIGMMFSQTSIGAERNVSLFPWLVPLGIYFLWRTWRTEERLWGVAATLCLTPYLVIYTLTPLIFLVSVKSWRWGLAMNAASWGYVALVVLGFIDKGL